MSGLCILEWFGVPVTVIASRCGADVTQAHVTRFDTGHPVLVAQLTITDIIVNDVGDFGIYSNCPQPGRHILTDIRAVGQYFVTAADPAVLNSILPSGLVSEYREMSGHPRTTQRRHLERSSPAVTTAVAVTAAARYPAASGNPGHESGSNYLGEFTGSMGLARNDTDERFEARGYFL